MTQNDLVYLPAALEFLKIATELTERYANGDLNDTEFRDLWKQTVSENSLADAGWFSGLDDQQAVS